MLNQGGNLVTAVLDPARIHAGTMVPIAIGTLSALAGLFLVSDDEEAAAELPLQAEAGRCYRIAIAVTPTSRPRANALRAGVVCSRAV